jgi:hypothetical protein
LLHVEAEVVIEDVGRFAFAAGDGRVDPGLAQTVEKPSG